MLDFDDVDEELDLDSIPVADYEDVSSSVSYNSFLMFVFQLPEDAICPWIELPHNEVPMLELPCSSNDIVLDSSLILDALEVSFGYFV